MGTWGPDIFDDDVTADVRADYQDLLEARVPCDRAAQHVIEEYAHLDEDEQHLLWLALAAAQADAGRLDDEVRAKAVHVIESGEGLHLWEPAGPEVLAERITALAALRARLDAVPVR